MVVVLALCVVPAPMSTFKISLAGAGTTRAVRQSVTAKVFDCTAAETRAAFRSFVSAFNAGDYGRLDSVFAKAPGFGWFSSPRPGVRLNAAATRRDTLVRYFRSRHLKRDRLRVLSFRFNGGNGVGNFEFKLRRSASDYRRAAWFGLIGKGAASCVGPRVQFIVVSLGGPGSDKP